MTEDDAYWMGFHAGWAAAIDKAASTAFARKGGYEAGIDILALPEREKVGTDDAD